MPPQLPPDALPIAPPDNTNYILLVIRWRVTRGVLVFVAVALSLFYARTYGRLYQPQYGWTKMIQFGGFFAPRALPRLQHTQHYASPPTGYGYDGQFYAQMALDPSLRDPAFDQALDSPTYRARRIGLPALVFVAGLGKPRYIIQVYAVANLFFWFVLAAVLFRLFRPTTGRQLLCLSTALTGIGIVASMESSLTDLPSAAMLFGALLMGSWGVYAGVAVAALTRETSVLAAFGVLDPRQTWRGGAWKKHLAKLALAGVPLALWLLYVHQRFGRLHDAAGIGNFDLPLRSMFLRMGEAIWFAGNKGLHGEVFRDPLLGWLYGDPHLNDLWVVVGLFCQGLYLCLRPRPASPIWRIGILYWTLCLVLGPSVWEGTPAAARAVLPMTICFYRQIADERGRWFWPFFLLGSLSAPHAVYEFWVVT